MSDKIEMTNPELTFEVTAFYDEKLAGISDRATDLTFEEAKDTLHEYISKGGYVQVRCNETGVDKVFNYDEYFDGFEGESPLQYGDFTESTGDMQKYLDAYKEYYDDYEEGEYDEYFGDFVDDFKAMEDCKTNGELADWFNDYIYNKGLTEESLYDIVNGESENFESVSEWIDKVEQFEGIALWVEKVANSEIDRDEPVSKDSRNELEEQYACEEYENGDSFYAICRIAQTTGEGEKTMNNETMNNENLDLPTFGYCLEIGIKQLVNFAFNKTDGLDMKDCLIEEVVEDFMEYDQVPFIERLKEKLDLPTTEEAEEVYYGINADEWSAILNVKFDRENADIQDIYDGRGGSNGTVTINADVTVNTTLFADICKEHGLDIKGDKMNSFSKEDVKIAPKKLDNTKEK